MQEKILALCKEWKLNKDSPNSSCEDCQGFLFVYTLPTKTLQENMEDVEKAVKNKKQKKKASEKNARKP